MQLSFHLDLTERPNSNFKGAFPGSSKGEGVNIFSLRSITNKIFASMAPHWVRRLTTRRAIQGGTKAMRTIPAPQTDCTLKEVTVVTWQSRHFADQINPTPQLCFQKLFHAHLCQPLLKYCVQHGFLLATKLSLSLDLFQAIAKEKGIL